MILDLDEIFNWISKAGDIGLGFFRKRSQWRLKKDSTLVSEADSAVESYLVTRIESRYPGHDIVGEEGSRVRGSEYSWIIDPIDGTLAFIAGVATWCISVGILRSEEPYWGLVYFPVTEEVYTVDDSGQARWNGRPISVSTGVDRPNSIVCISSRFLQRYSFLGSGNTCSFASGVMHSCLVARGAADAAVTLRPRLWDLAGIYPVLIAAGGAVSYVDGHPFHLRDLIKGSPSRPIVVGNPSSIEHVIDRMIEL